MLRTMSSNGSYGRKSEADWSGARDQLRARGLRWTPQRRTLIDVLSRLDGLATAIEAYANPDLAVDVLLLAWPRTPRAA